MKVKVPEKQFRDPLNCAHCRRNRAALFAEGETVMDDAFYWQSRHGSDTHPNQISFVQLLTIWMEARGVTLDQLGAMLEKQRESDN
jgi:hypothetical protein